MTMDVFYFRKISNAFFLKNFLWAFSIVSLFLATQGEQVGWNMELGGLEFIWCKSFGQNQKKHMLLLTNCR